MIEQTVDTRTTPSVAASLFDLCLNVAAKVKTDDGKPFNEEAFLVMMASMFVRKLAVRFGHQTALSLLQVNAELLNEERSQVNQANQPSQQGN